MIASALRRDGLLPPLAEPELPKACRLTSSRSLAEVLGPKHHDDNGETVPAAPAGTLSELPSLPPLPPLPASACASNLGPTDTELISVVCPTTDARHWAHPLLYHSFTTQTHMRKELLVFDTGGARSPFFDQLDDPRVSYYHVGPGYMTAWANEQRDPAPDITARWPELRGDPLLLRAASGKLSIGEKRNFLSRRASGTLIANFDDDDLYLPSYIARMSSALRRYDADLVKLGSWLLFDCEQEGALSYYQDPGPSEMGHSIRWGFGFSYVSTTELVRAHHYPPTSMGEDYAFVFEAARAGHSCLAFSDSVGDATVCHVSHGHNTSKAAAFVTLAFPGIGGADRLTAALGTAHGYEARGVLEALVDARAALTSAAADARWLLQERLAKTPSRRNAGRIYGVAYSEQRGAQPCAPLATPALDELIAWLGGRSAATHARQPTRLTREEIDPATRAALTQLLEADRSKLDDALKAALGADVKLGMRLRLVNELRNLV